MTARGNALVRYYGVETAADYLGKVAAQVPAPSYITFWSPCLRRENRRDFASKHLKDIVPSDLVKAPAAPLQEARTLCGEIYLALTLLPMGPARDPVLLGRANQSVP